MAAIAEVAGEVEVATLCQVLGISRATAYRRRRPDPVGAKPRRPRSARALGARERAQVLEVLNCERFVDSSPAAVWATLLDEGTYLASQRTFYRVLSEAAGTRERRHQLTHPSYVRPELLATRPNEVWSWDISKLMGPAKWSYFHLYVILDIFSRYAVGWMLAHRESAALAQRLIAGTVDKQGVAPGDLTIHADRGTSMRSKPVALLLSDLGITKTHSRPYTSTDNPYSEAAFKTLKYRPAFPERFGSIEDARAFCTRFFAWYNTCHRHSGIGLMTPEAVHYGTAGEIHARRAEVLAAAYGAHPERFHALPKPPALPTAAWINSPKEVTQ